MVVKPVHGAAGEGILFVDSDEVPGPRDPRPEPCVCGGYGDWVWAGGSRVRVRVIGRCESVSGQRRDVGAAGMR